MEQLAGPDDGRDPRVVLLAEHPQHEVAAPLVVRDHHPHRRGRITDGRPPLVDDLGGRDLDGGVQHAVAAAGVAQDCLHGGAGPGRDLVEGDLDGQLLLGQGRRRAQDAQPGRRLGGGLVNSRR
ncbi:hypothetical protein [Asanoa siamensis]|uniref:Uncharacterized protein n=1 Tax=Asanoa siamensis TaxID=926357 RepID=A0ABQ4CSA4_9ACTN|nr:hypothetical protein [Asanoa siamensis]GIF73883.1 hypothetical protein Asi02nite_34010 [Asanoa siamensis]